MKKSHIIQIINNRSVILIYNFPIPEVYFLNKIANNTVSTHIVLSM